MASLPPSTSSASASASTSVDAAASVDALLATSAQAPPSDLLAKLQDQVMTVTAARTANAAEGKALDDKLTRAFKAPPKRPHGAISEAQLDEEMRKLELRRNTTSMTLAEEKFIVRELEQMQERKTQVRQHAQFQSWVDATKKERQERFQRHRAFDEQLQQLQAAIKKATLAVSLGCRPQELASVEIQVPEDRMGALIGKGGAVAKRLEEQHGLLLDVDHKTNRVRVTSAPSHMEDARAAVEAITLAVPQTLGLHPDTVKVLMAQRAKHLHGLEASLALKLDLNRPDGLLSTVAAPAKLTQLKRALKELEEGKVELAVPSEVVPKLIGKKGEAINQLMEDTGALIDIDKVTNAVKIGGPRESVAKARRFVEALIEDESQRERVYAVATHPELFPSPLFADYKFALFAEFLMGHKAHQLKLLRVAAGEPRIQVSKSEQRLLVTGNKAQLSAVEEALRERLHVFEDHHWALEVTNSFVLSLIIGKRGQTIKAIETRGKEAHIKVDIIQSRVVGVLGDSADAIATAAASIQEIVDQNQRSVFLTSQNLVAVLLGDKRAKLTELEGSTKCKIQLPPPPSVTAAATATATTTVAATATATATATGTAPPGSSSLSKASSSTPTNAAATAVSQQVKITLTGTKDAIAAATSALEALDDAHHVRYLPLDSDEVPTVIGKKGETISQLERDSGAKLRILKDSTSPLSELEMLGTNEQLDQVQAAIDALLQTQHRELLQLDAFATGCVIGKKGERIKALRAAHPDASVDAFATRGQVRIKATSQEALDACVADVQRLLRETMVVESVRMPGTVSASTTFPSLISQSEALGERLQELEAEGGDSTKVTFLEDGRVARIRGSALAIGTLKSFLEMLIAPDALFVESIKLPSLSMGNVLLAKDDRHALNENALRICKQTGCELRVKRVAAVVLGGGTGGQQQSRAKRDADATKTQDKGTGKSKGKGKDKEKPQKVTQEEDEDVAAGVVLIQGSDPAKVYDARAQVNQVLQFYHSECMTVLRDLPPSAVPRLYELLPSLAVTHRVVLSRPDKQSLRVFADSKATTEAVALRLREELARWQREHVVVPVPSWLVPALVGKNGEQIKKLSAECNHAKLELNATVAAASSSASSSPSLSSFSSGWRPGGGGALMIGDDERWLTISAREEDTLALAVRTVKAFIEAQEYRTECVDVPAKLVDLVMAAKREMNASGLQLHVVAIPASDKEENTKENEPTTMGAATDKDKHGASEDDKMVRVVLVGGESEAREALREKIEHVVSTCVVTRVAVASGAMVGALIGKSGAHIKALQNEFPRVRVDIQRDAHVIELKGPREEVVQVQRIMEDKMQELQRHQDAYETRVRSAEEDRRQHQQQQSRGSRGGVTESESSDENAQSVNGATTTTTSTSSTARSGPTGPVGGLGTEKLTKNQRRRLRKRAEVEKQSDVLAMLVGGEGDGERQGPGASEAVGGEDGGYYHSKSGYSLRL